MLNQPWPADEVKTLTVSCPANENRFDRCNGSVKPKIAMKLTPSSFEAGSYLDGSGQFTEQLVLQYYATEGLFESDVRRAQVPESAFAARKPGEITMWLVGHDNRGGVVWETRRVRAE